ncbi:MAG: NADH-quinone oxidoreductase subunit J [bacterium]|nr:NADH-quinone oxidoreductase subunit J [bacterium]
METVLFYLFAALTLASGLMVITRRNPVASALYLVLCFFGLAGIYVLMDAYFLAAIQIAVYAGAIMVLFLFVIMLLRLEPTELPSFMNSWSKRLYVAVTLVLGGVFLGLDLMRTVNTGADSALTGEAGAIADRLFNRYLLPFEVTALLLLVAIVGAVVMARRESPKPTASMEEV